jgi:hypothetical protein
MGGTGTGKTLLGLHFLVEGARRGEPGVLFTLEENPGQLREIAGRFPFDFAVLEQKGLVHLRYVPPIELSTDRFLHEVRREVASIMGVMGRGGGYIASPTHDVNDDVPPENILAMLEVFHNQPAQRL